MFARLVKLQLSMLPAFSPENRGTVTLPQGVIAHGDVTARLGLIDRPSVFALYRAGTKLSMRLYFGPTLYVDATFTPPPQEDDEDVNTTASVRVYKDGAEIMSGPWEAMFSVWRPAGRLTSVNMVIKDLNVILDGDAFKTALEGTWLGAP